MTNPKPTEGWAIVAKGGAILDAHPNEGTAHAMCPWDATIIPVTIIPTADLVKEAARVLLGAFDNDRTDSPVDYQAVYEAMAEVYRISGWTDWPEIIDAALRALAGQGGE